MAAISDKTISEIKVQSYRVIWLSLSLIVFQLAFYQIPGEAPDWQEYNYFFNLLRTDGLDLLGTSRFEPGFVIVGFYLTVLFSSNLTVFGLIAAISIALKCWAINQFSSSRMVFFVVMLFYLIRFAPLHEFTQLRVACSIAFLFVALVFSWRGKLIASIAACAAALIFHFTSVAIIPLVLLMHLRDRLIQFLSLKNVITLSLAVFVATSFGIKLAVNYFQDIFLVVAMYQQAGFGDEAANPLSTVLLLDWGMIIVGLVLWGRLPPMMRYVLLLELIGRAIFYAAIDFQVVAHRFREMLEVFWVFFVVLGLQQKKPVKEISVLFVIASFVLYSYLYFFSGKFFL